MVDFTLHGGVVGVEVTFGLGGDGVMVRHRVFDF